MCTGWTKATRIGFLDPQKNAALTNACAQAPMHRKGFVHLKRGEDLRLQRPPLSYSQCDGKPCCRVRRSLDCFLLCRGKNVARNIASALAFMHKKGVVHLDVKSANILLTSNNIAKLGYPPTHPPPS